MYYLGPVHSSSHVPKYFKELDLIDALQIFFSIKSLLDEYAQTKFQY